MKGLQRALSRLDRSAQRRPIRSAVWVKIKIVM